MNRDRGGDIASLAEFRDRVVGKGRLIEAEGVVCDSARCGIFECVYKSWHQQLAVSCQ